jgi:hypothetical protein
MPTRGHDGIGCNVMKNGPQYTDAMKRATSHLDCPGGSTNNVVCMYEHTLHLSTLLHCVFHKQPAVS